MLPRRIVLASLIAASLLAAGCIKEAARSLGELQAVRSEINKKFGEDVNVHLGQGISTTLTVTFINSPLNDRTPAERAQRAQETVHLIKANYVRIQLVKEIWVTFVRQKTRLFFFHYSEGFEVYGFDNKGERLALGLGTGDPAPPLDKDIIVGYAASTGETDVSTTANFQLEGEPGGYGITVLPHFKVQGDARRRKAPAPKAVSFYFASYSKIPRFGVSTPFEFIADGTPVMQGKLSFSGSDAEYSYVDIPYPVFRKLVAAQIVAIKLGAREYPLTPEQLVLLQRMDAYVQK